MILQYGLFDIHLQRRIGRLSQQRVDGLLCGVVAGIQNEAGYRQTHPTVDIPLEEMGDQGCRQNGGGGNAVAERIGSGGKAGAMHAVVIVFAAKSDVAAVFDRAIEENGEIG